MSLIFSRLPILSLLVAIAGCSEAPGTPPPAYAKYLGDAFPNPYAKIPWPQHEFAITSDNGSDTLTAIDLQSHGVIAKLPVGRNPVDNDGPHHLAIDLKGNHVFVALAYPAPTTAPGPHARHGSSVLSGFVQRLDLATLRIDGELPIEPNPGDIVLSQDGKRLVVSHFDLARANQKTLSLHDRRGNISLILDPGTLGDAAPAEPTLIRTCLLPHGIALTRPDGALAVVACYGEDSIALVDLNQPKLEPQLIAVGPAPGPTGTPVYGPYSAVLSPDGTRVAVGNTEKGDVRFLDVFAKTMQPLVIANGLPGKPYFMAWRADGAQLWIPTQQQDAIVRADAATGEILAARKFGADQCVRPHEAQLSKDDIDLLVVCEGGHGGLAAPTHGKVLVLDPQTLVTRAEIATGIYPDRLAIARVP